MTFHYTSWYWGRLEVDLFLRCILTVKKPFTNKKSYIVSNKIHKNTQIQSIAIHLAGLLGCYESEHRTYCAFHSYSFLKIFPNVDDAMCELGPLTKNMILHIFTVFNTFQLVSTYSNIQLLTSHLPCSPMLITNGQHIA